jgi:hypothetical protein
VLRTALGKASENRFLREMPRICRFASHGTAMTIRQGILTIPKRFRAGWMFIRNKN